jgi:hypothetical protein
MKRVAYGLAGLLVVLVVAALLAPALIDTPAVRAEIQRRVDAALQGRVTWEALEVAIFPAPHGELRKVRIEIPQKVSVEAERFDVYIRLWPLLRGNVEISSVSAVRPAVRITPATKAEQSRPEPLALYRAAMDPVARALREFAPDMTLKVERAAIEVAPLALRDLDASARTDSRGVALTANASSNFWKQLALEGRVEYADLAARASISLDGLIADKDVPPVSLRATLHTDGRSTLEAEFDGAAAPLVASLKGKAALTGVQVEAERVDVARALELVKRKGIALPFIEAPRGHVSAKGHFVPGPPWSAEVDIAKSDAALKIAQLPWELSAQAARVAVTPDSVKVSQVNGRVGESTVHNAAVHIELGKTPRVAAASGQATANLAQWVEWLRDKAPLEEVASVSGSAEVTLKHLALRFDRPADADFEASATPRDARAVLKMLPSPVSASGGAVQVSRKQVRFDKVAVGMLDASGEVSGTYDVGKSAVELSVSDGSTGERLVQWALERGAVPARFEPKTPLRFAASRIAWAPKGALQAEVSVDFPEGQALGVRAAWRPERLEIPLLSIKDARSDARMSAALEKDLVHASFSGTLQSQSVPAMLRQPLPEASGTLRGDMRLTIDRARPERTIGQGRLRVEALDLGWLAGRAALIERAELVAEAEGARIIDGRFGVDGQFFDLQAQWRRTERGPVVDARLESAGVDVYRLLPPPDPNAPRRKSSEAWPLPLSGRVELRTGFVQYKDYRIEPFDGVVSLEPERVRVEVKQARMCGVSFPSEIELTPDLNSAAVHVRVQNEPLERTVQCLTRGRVQLTGNADVTAELRTQGRRPHLLRDMTGTLQAEVRDGRVNRFALIGNILSIRNIASPHKMLDEGFPYRRMTARGHFKGGALQLEEGFFDSDAVRIAASGQVDLLGQNSQLEVLVGLLTTVDRIAEAVPIIGDIFGGSMTAIPMGVSGDIRDPLIVPLGPRAVTGHLLGIFERTLKLPGKLLVKPEPAPKP